MVDRVHGHGVRGLLRRMMERNEPGLMAEAPRRIDRAGARRLMVAAEGEAGMTGADADAGSGRILSKNAPSRAALVIYGAVIAGFMGTSLKGPQHAWSASGLLGSPPDSGAGDKESMMISKMSAVGVVSVMMASQAGAANAVQWRVEDGGNGHWYRFNAAQSNWDAAQASSVAVGGHLVTITSPEERSFILQLRQAGGNIGKWCWFGGYVSATGCTWSWVTNEPFFYTNWLPGQPNCGSPTERISSLGVDWGDMFGTYDDQHSITEWSADCNNDNIVDFGQIFTGQLADTNANGIPDVCEVPTCVDADLYRNGHIDGADLAALLSEWGPVTPATNSDFNHDGRVDGSDLAFLLANWGPCPQ